MAIVSVDDPQVKKATVRIANTSDRRFGSCQPPTCARLDSKSTGTDKITRCVAITESSFPSEVQYGYAGDTGRVRNCKLVVVPPNEFAGPSTLLVDIIWPGDSSFWNRVYCDMVA
jgi:hypothetical protein